MSRTAEIRAIIAGHRGARPGMLAEAVRARLGPGASAREVADAVSYCRQIIDAVPLLLDRLREEGARRGVATVVEHFVGDAERYFLRPADAVPEATFGEFGLLDDAWLALSIVRLVGRQEEIGLVRVELDGPLAFLEQLLGAAVIAALRAEKDKALHSLAARIKASEAAAGARRPAARPASPRGAAPSGVRQLCTACNGIGSTDCPSCGGHGVHTRSYSRIDWQGNVEHVTERTPCGCSGGRVVCPRCGGSGHR